jgi:hypothetical protein
MFLSIMEAENFFVTRTLQRIEEVRDGRSYLASTLSYSTYCGSKDGM